MPTPLNIGTRDIPLKLAHAIEARVKNSWDSGEMLSRITPVTRDLLKFWFCEPHTETRYINFHEGQRQAILNIVYLHEILGIDSVKGLYENIDPELLFEIDAAELAKVKYNIPKYAIKMATGTGKTWVLHAMVLWQYLNARHEEQPSGRFSKNFLLVAPGLIVYERLLDAYLGKENAGGERAFEKSDFYKFQDLFIPQNFRDEVFGFLQGCVAKKEEIGTKTTGDGLIAIANWHLFMDREEDESGVEGSPLDNPSGILKDIFPITPGVSGGNSLEQLDSSYFRGREFDFLAGLPDLVVFNDEAHHIHENRTYGEVQEVEWQKSLTKIAEKKGKRFTQIDFSATPYDVTGSGQKRTKHYFPHVVCDFDLKTAIHKGFVKMIAIDKRKELTDTPLDFAAIREGNKVLGLSDGQKLMIRAGLAKLGILEKHFVELTKNHAGVSNKHPKMLVVCEDTQVTPFVEEFLRREGLSEEDVMRVDSDRKGSIPEKEWQVIKQRLFNVDEHDKPKVIVSVLMLREGFDVNNICVIVPLRASEAPILLEQTIGRGLRLMWREPEFFEVKEENRRRVLVDKDEPNNYLDLLQIVEHPAFMEFYDELLKEGLLGEILTDPIGRNDVLGDIITVELRQGFEKYDFFWPVIIREADEELKSGGEMLEKLEPFTAFTLENLQNLVAKEGERFFSEEITVKTRFGEYAVTANLFTAESYNEYLEKVLNVVVNRLGKVSERRLKTFPVMQVNQTEVVRAIDTYIRERLFGKAFDPFVHNNWKILLLKNGIVTQHIVREIGKVVHTMQTNVEVSAAVVQKRYFSEVRELKMRESYSLDITKAIYERLAYPSNRGEFEKQFMLYVHTDGGVESMIKINEYYHGFAKILYLRTDGLLAPYSPDFLVKTAHKIYVVETKADKDVHDLNVKQKQLATIDWIKRINQLPTEDRMNRVWEYTLLGENHFYTMRDNGGSIEEILDLAKISEANIAGRLI